MPNSFSEACTIPKWAEAIDREFNALEERNTWTYIPYAASMSPLPYIWDFRIKDTFGAYGLIYKARCCLRGDKQVAYRDFDPENLYAPVARHESIRMLLALVAAQNLVLEGADVSNAYLYGDIDTPIIMHQPTDSTGRQKHPGMVCKLQKSLYGARQAGEIWGSVIHGKLLSWGFKQSSQDQRLYFLVSGSNFIVLLLVVDDMAFASTSQHMLDDLKGKLSASFKVKLLGPLKSFIGWTIRRTNNGITVCQGTYIERMLRLHNLSHVSSVPTPLPERANLNPREPEETPLSSIDHHRYRSLVGSLSYLAICTRPDISFAVSVLSRQLHDPCNRHLVLAKRVVRYISGTIHRALCFPAHCSSPLEAYVDSDWAGCQATRRSTTGIIILVNNAPIFWCSNRQSILALSSAEAEYIALSACGKSITWLRRLYWEMATRQPAQSEPKLPPTVVSTDSTSAISLAINRTVSERSKHIDLKVHHIRELRQSHVLILRHIRTSNQPADMLTKAVSYPVLQRLLTILGLLG